MAYSIVSLNELIAQFERLPGIGRKTATRLAYFVLEQNPEYAKRFAEALVSAKDKIHFCPVCQQSSGSPTALSRPIQ